MVSWSGIRRFGCVGLGFLLFFGNSLPADAGLLELSGNYYYSQSDLGSSGNSWTRRYGVSVGYYFWELSEIEFSVQDILYRTVITSVEDTTFHDQIYGVEWVQSFTTRKSVIQPFVKAGVGYLAREASGTYAGGDAPSASYNAFSVLLGAGFKIFILDFLALRAEGTTYLLQGALSTWNSNFSFHGGVSLYF